MAKPLQRNQWCSAKQPPDGTARRLAIAVVCGVGPIVSAGSARAQTSSLPIDTAKVHAVFNEYAGHASPGCAVGVYHRGSVVFSRGYGMADLERNVPITPSTLFDLGSTAKQFAAAAIGLLVADGKVRFDDDVRRYVPEVPDVGPVITIDHLLRHTSGLRDYVGLLILSGRLTDDASDDAEALDIIGRQRALNFEPGAEWDYSNSGFFLLSVIVERVSGQTLPEFARARIFEPLGMTRTHFRNDHTAILPGRALGYSPGSDGALRYDVPNWDQVGDGAVWSSVEELVRWDRNFVQRSVGGDSLVAWLEAVGSLNDGSPHGYGRGLFVDRYRGLHRVHHGGAWGGYRAMLMRFPSAHTSVAITCNVGTADTQRLAEGVADVVLADRLAPVPTPTRTPTAGARPSARQVDPAQYTGLFYSETEQSLVRVVTRDGLLVARTLGSAAPLRAVGDERFEASALPVVIQFQRSAGRPASALQLEVAGRSRGTHRRVVAVEPTVADLRAYEGRYHSPELNTEYRVVVEADTLRLITRGFGRLTLEPAMSDSFSSLGLVHFSRDRRNRVAGFTFSISRVRGLTFERRRDSAER